MGAEFCILACKTDKTFADNYSLDALNEYATDTTHKTLGETINGYRIHLRTSAVGLNDLF